MCFIYNKTFSHVIIKKMASDPKLSKSDAKAIAMALSRDINPRDIKNC